MASTDIDPEHLHQKVAAHHLKVLRLGEASSGPQEDEDSGGQSHVHGGPRERHQEFLAGILGHPLQTSHSTNGQKRDVAGGDPEAAGRQGMAQFMQDDNKEEDRNENQAVKGVDKTLPGQVILEADPAQESAENVTCISTSIPAILPIFHDHFMATALNAIVPDPRE